MAYDKNNIKIQIFEGQKVRTVWSEEEQQWYFSIVDICWILTESKDYDTARKYWNKLKQRLVEEGNESVTNCHQLKLVSPKDGKRYLTDVATQPQLFRIIQSIPSKKAEPFKQWMAQVASDRLDQMQDPELNFEQAYNDYRRLGYSDKWINQRLKSIEIRKALTDEWDTQLSPKPIDTSHNWSGKHIAVTARNISKWWKSDWCNKAATEIFVIRTMADIAFKALPLHQLHQSSDAQWNTRPA